MNLEEIYGKLWRLSAKAEGHTRKFPSNPMEQVKSHAPTLILATLEGGPAKMTGLAASVGMGKAKLTNHLYKMRQKGLVHSVYNGRFVRWHLGPERAAA